MVNWGLRREKYIRLLKINNFHSFGPHTSCKLALNRKNTLGFRDVEIEKYGPGTGLLHHSVFSARPAYGEKKRATGAEKLKSRLRLNKPDYSTARGRNTTHESR